MAELLTAFTLGNSAILTNVCLLPLYPGLIAFLAGNLNTDETKIDKSMYWLGVLVLAGVLSTMLLIGCFLYLLKQPFSAILPVILPVSYGLIIVMGLMTIAGRNPFVKLQTVQNPIFQNPHATAYAYGVFLAPMTLPCTGPLILSTFVLGVGSFASLVEGITFFLAFGLGFGWPLVLLPLVAQPLQLHFITWLTDNHKKVNIISGLLLIGIGIIGIIYELIPQLGL